MMRRRSDFVAVNKQSVLCSVRAVYNKNFAKQTS